MTWFSWDPEEGATFHDTEAAAKAAAEASLFAERDGAADGGWSEAVEDICWGKVLGCAVEVERREPDEEYPEGLVNYALRDVEPAVYVVEQKPLTAAEREITRQVVEETAGYPACVALSHVEPDGAP